MIPQEGGPLLEAAVTTPSVPQRHLPGEVGLWVFIGGDLLVFGIFFIIYTWYHGVNTDIYVQSQELLNQGFGVLNTVVLLSSSWFAASAVQAARKGNTRLVPWLLAATFLCGLCFCMVKVFEYGEKIRAGITLNTNEFFVFYYMFTGIHLVHVLVGMGLLVFVWAHSRKDSYVANDIQTIEIGVSFWHLVDLLWIVLFALLYLLR
jgi:nitric oxide reductase NorE protein